MRSIKRALMCVLSLLIVVADPITGQDVVSIEAQQTQAAAVYDAHVQRVSSLAFNILSGSPAQTESFQKTLDPAQVRTRSNEHLQSLSLSATLPAKRWLGWAHHVIILSQSVQRLM